MFWTKPFYDDTIQFGLDFEVSSFCNAKCPLCGRHVSGTPILSPSLKQSNISLEEFKEWFPPSIIKRVGKLSFCGNFGDPCMNPHLVEMLEYVREHNINVPITIRTNGGLRDEAFWTDLGRLVNIIIFSVDGLEDTNHLYRIGVKWDKVIRNFKSCIASSHKHGHIVEWEYLIFKHNQHQIEEAVALSRELKVDTIQFKRPAGLEWENKHQSFPVRDKDGNALYTLELAEEHYIKGLELNLKSVEEFEPIDMNERMSFVKYGRRTTINFDQYSEIEGCNIRCKMNKGGGKIVDMFISSVGDLLPCCFIGSEYYNPIAFTNAQLIERIPANKISLRNNSFKEVLEFFDAEVYGKWNSTHKEGKLIRCSQVCGVQNPLNKSFYNKDRITNATAS